MLTMDLFVNNKLSNLLIEQDIRMEFSVVYRYHSDT